MMMMVMILQVSDGQHAWMGQSIARQLAQSTDGAAAQNTHSDACAWNDTRFAGVCWICPGCYHAGVSVGESNTHA